MKRKIKRPNFTPSGKIQNKTTLDEGFLKFSFKYLDLHGNPKFSLSHCEGDYLDKLLCRLRDISGLPIEDFRWKRRDSVRSHPISWAETTEPEGFKHLNPQLREEEAWQFQITKDIHGRIHGLLLEDIFFVIWIDPRHKLYQ